MVYTSYTIGPSCAAVNKKLAEIYARKAPKKGPQSRALVIIVRRTLEEKDCFTDHVKLEFINGYQMAFSSPDYKSTNPGGSFITDFKSILEKDFTKEISHAAFRSKSSHFFAKALELLSCAYTKRERVKEIDDISCSEGNLVQKRQDYDNFRRKVDLIYDKVDHYFKQYLNELIKKYAKYGMKVVVKIEHGDLLKKLDDLKRVSSLTNDRVVISAPSEFTYLSDGETEHSVNLRDSNLEDNASVVITIDYNAESLLNSQDPEMLFKVKYNREKLYPGSGSRAQDLAKVTGRAEENLFKLPEGGRKTLEEERLIGEKMKRSEFYKYVEPNMLKSAPIKLSFLDRLLSAQRITKDMWTNIKEVQESNKVDEDLLWKGGENTKGNENTLGDMWAALKEARKLIKTPEYLWHQEKNMEGYEDAWGDTESWEWRDGGAGITDAAIEEGLGMFDLFTFGVDLATKDKMLSDMVKAFTEIDKETIKKMFAKELKGFEDTDTRTYFTVKTATTVVFTVVSILGVKKVMSMMKNVGKIRSFKKIKEIFKSLDDDLAKKLESIQDLPSEVFEKARNFSELAQRNFITDLAGSKALREAFTKNPNLVDVWRKLQGTKYALDLNVYKNIENFVKSSGKNLKEVLAKRMPEKPDDLERWLKLLNKKGVSPAASKKLDELVESSLTTFSNSKRPGAAAVMEGDNFKAVAKISVRGVDGAYFPGINPTIKEILEAIPSPNRAKGHGKCAEVQVLSDVLNKKFKDLKPTLEQVSDYLKGTKSKAVSLQRSSKKTGSHGKFKCACSSCTIVLKKLKISETSH